MDRDAIKQRLERTRKRVAHVLDRYCAEEGCPCGYAPFVYWAGKQQGPGWQDNVQNQLVRSAIQLACFSKVARSEKVYGLAGAYVCDTCGTAWNHFSEEWRMLAFHERLLKIGGDDPSTLYHGLISDSVAATVGFAPYERKALSLDAWMAFMLGEGC